jgi:predicted metal-dependent HD superfamily phosphohydrolase
MELPQHWPLPQAASLRDDLLAAYADRSRHFHDTKHLSEVLARLDEIAAGGTAFDDVPVRLAAWFHDAISDCERDAEERSAARAEQALADLCPEPLVAEVARLVRLTETHAPEPGDANGAALSVADLAVLASEPARYAEYVAGVRREYAHITDEEWRVGRAELLRGLLAREPLFHTEHGHARWEEPARRNLAAELQQLLPSDDVLVTE